jgi:hypothetical protein
MGGRGQKVRKTIDEDELPCEIPSLTNLLPLYLRKHALE